MISIYCFSSRLLTYDPFDFLGQDAIPSRFLERLLGDISPFDDSSWMVWRKSTVKPDAMKDASSSKQATNNQILLQKVNGSIADLLQEFDSQWPMFLKHSYITAEQSDYIRRIKIEASEYDTIIVHIDFAENYNLIHQNSIMQAHWTTQQAAIFTVHIQVNKDNHHSMAIISDYLEHDVEFVHAAQNVIVDYVQSVYPMVKKINYVSDGAPQHFRNNKNILNLTYHSIDFGIPASWTFCATVHGKSAVDGIEVAIKHRATREVLYGNSSCVILTSEDLDMFARYKTMINVFYMSRNTVKKNTQRYCLYARWNEYGVNGQYESL